MADANGRVDIDVNLNPSQALSDADKIGQDIGKKISAQVDSASRSATDQLSQQTTKAVNEIGATVESYGKTYSKAVTLPIVGAAVATGAAAIDIDTALTGVRKTVDGTEEQYEALKDAAIEFSQTNAVDPAQILDIQALGAQLGYSIGELDEFGEVVSGLDIATNMDAESAAMELASFANIMKMSHDETRNYGSTIVDLGNHFATTESDISHMAQRIAGAGKQIGMSEADVLGLATALSSMGINAEAGGTAVSTVMSNIDKAVANGGDKLQTWAETAQMSAEEFTEAWKDDPVQALNAVLVGMDAATQEGGNMSLMLEELGISSIRQTDMFKRLANNVEMLPKAVQTANRAWEENTALEKEVENRNNSMAAQLEILTNKIKAIAVEVGEPLMHALIGIIDQAQPLIDALASGAKAFSDLDENGQRLVLTAVGIVAAFGPANVVFGKMLSNVGKNAKAWSDFKENLKTVKTNIAATTAEITKQAAAQGKYRTITAGNLQATVKYNEATGKAKIISTQLQSATKAQTVAMKASTVATKAGAVGMNVLKTAANGLKAVLLTVMPIAIFTVAVELITRIADAFGVASEKADRNKKATDGLTSSMNEYRKAYLSTSNDLNKAAEGAKYYAASLDSVQKAAEAAAEKQAQLSEKLTDSWKETGTNTALVENYAKTIKDLTDGYDENGNKVKLNAKEQAELIAAVNGLNDVMGTTYSVIDAENGILSESTSVILANAGAWQKRALAEAASMANTELMKQHIENQTAIREATRLVTQEQNNLNNATSDFESAMYAQRLRDAEAALQDLESQDAAVVREMENTQEVIAELSDVYASSTDSLNNYVNATKSWKEALENADVDISQFSQALSDISVSTEDLANIFQNEGVDGINRFISAYKSGSGDLLAEAERLGIEIPDATRQMMTSVVQGVEEGGQEAVSAAGNAAEQANAEFKKPDTESSGRFLSQGLARGIGAGAASVVAAARDVAQQALNAIRETGGEGSPWKETIKSGKFATQGLAKGITSEKKTILDAGTYIANTVNGSITQAFQKNPISVPISNISEETKKVTKEFGEAVGAANATTANLNRLFARTGVRYSKDFVDKIKSGGEEYKKMLADMANWSDAQVQHMVDAFDAVSLAERETDLAARALYVDSLKYFTFENPREWLLDFKETVLDVKEAVYSDRGLSNAMELAGVTVEELAADVQGLDLTMSDFVNSMDGYVDRVSDGFSKMSRKNQTSLENWVSNLRENIKESQLYSRNLQQVFGKLSVDVDADAFRKAVMEGGYDKFGKIISDMASMSPKQIEAIVKQYNQAIQQAQVSAVQDMTSISSGAEIMNATIQGVMDAQNGLIQAASNVSQAGANAIGAQAPKYYQMGQDLSRGVATGISSRSDEIAAAMASAISSAMKAAKDKAEIKSPSKKAKREIGWMLSEGVAVGIDERADDIRDSMGKAVSDALGVDFNGVVDASGVVWESSGEHGGELIAKGIIAGFDDFDPMNQIGRSIEKGISAINLTSMAQPAPSVYNSNQTNNFYSPVQTPDEYARTMRMQRHYGLAGGN